MSGIRTLTRGERLGVAVLVVLLLLPLRGMLRAQGPPMEEGFMLVFPERLLAGDLPNRDFLHLYGPGSLWVLAVVYQVLGAELWVERLVGFAQQAGVVFGVFALCRPYGPIVATVGGAVALVVIVPPIGLTALAWTGAVAFLLWATRALLLAIGAGPDRPATSGGAPPAGATGTGVDAGADGGGTAALGGSVDGTGVGPPTPDRRSRRLVTAAALLAAAALLYRPDQIVAVTLVALVVGRRLPADLRRRGLLALAAGLSPYLLHLLLSGPGNVVHGMLVEPVFDLRGGRRLPLPPSWDRYDGFLQRAGALHEPPWPLPSLPGPAQISVWVFGLAAVVVALLAVARRRRDVVLLAGALLSLGLLPQALQRADTTHLAWVSCVPFGLLAAALPRRLAPAALVVPLLVVPYFTVRSWGDYVAQTFDVHRLAYPIEHRGRLFYYGRPDAAAAAEDLLADVERLTEPGDRMLVGSGDLRFTPYSDAYLYHLLPDRPPATRYIEMDPGVANAPDSGLADEVREADLVVLSRVWDDWEEPNDSLVPGPDEPNEVLHERFCLAGTYGGLYELWLPAGRCPPQ